MRSVRREIAKRIRGISPSRIILGATALCLVASLPAYGRGLGGVSVRAGSSYGSPKHQYRSNHHRYVGSGSVRWTRSCSCGHWEWRTYRVLAGYRLQKTKVWVPALPPGHAKIMNAPYRRGGGHGTVGRGHFEWRVRRVPYYKNIRKRVWIKGPCVRSHGGYRTSARAYGNTTRLSVSF